MIPSSRSARQGRQGPWRLGILPTTATTDEVAQRTRRKEPPIEALQDYRERLQRLLGDRDPIGVLEATPERLRAVRTRLGAGAMARSYRPGAWTAHELFAHLADSELLMGTRMRQVLANDDHVVEPMDQDAWARRYAELDPDLALTTFRVLRDWNLALLGQLGPEDERRGYRHPEEPGRHLFGDMVRHVAAHDLNHLEQLERIAEG